MNNKKKKITLRKCISCSNQKEKKELIRIVKTKENNIFIDLTFKKNGRGIYICKNINCLNLTIKNKRLNNLLQDNIDAEFYEKLREIIMQTN